MAPSLVLLDRLERSCPADPRDSVVPRCRVDPTDGVRVVGVCRLALSCSNRDSLCTRGLFVADGFVVLERNRVLELAGDRVAPVYDLDGLTELFVGCSPIRLPIVLRERDELDEGVLLGSGVVVEGLE